MDLLARIHGMWLGKSIGGTLGLPAEGRTERQHFTYYDPVPTQAPPNDDLELQIVWLELLERRGPLITAEDLGQAWLDHIHYMWDEYGRCRWNLRRGVPAASAGSFENAFHAGMGSPIRSEIWACAAVGQPDLAEAYARLDSLLDHGPEGAAGEVFLAVLECLVLAGQPLPAALTAARRRVDPGTELAAALDLVFTDYQRGVDVWQAHGSLVAAHRHENFTHAPLNVALIAWALLHGNADADRTLLLAVNCGWDTDCTCASAGAVLGALGGPAVFDSRWTKPIGDGVYLGPGMIALRDPPRTLGQLSERSLRLAEQRSTAMPVVPASRWVDMSTLRGTILLHPLDGSPAIPWANGELPTGVKAAGGATWDWLPGARNGLRHFIVSLADTGCRLSVAGSVVVDCPAGLPYVPAVHRCPAGSRTACTALATAQRIELRLGSCDPRQRASVILAEANMDLTTWDGTALPHQGQLPAA
jgi:ADP-ribosylglycohydrolase